MQRTQPAEAPGRNWCSARIVTQPSHNYAENLGFGARAIVLLDLVCVRGQR